ncbi:MAG: hypothetical protein Q9219_007393 [cf. Caloplaca sp. 3 TL-2023]
MIALWIGAFGTLAPTATYAVLDLYGQPENLEPLQQEARGPAFSHFMAAGQGLPLMDSFLQESMRLSMSDSSKGIFETRRIGKSADWYESFGPAKSLE